MPVYLQHLQLNSFLTLWRLKCNGKVDEVIEEKFKVLKLKSVDCEQGNRTRNQGLINGFRIFWHLQIKDNSIEGGKKGLCYPTFIYKMLCEQFTQFS